MTEDKDNNPDSRRTQINELPREEKKLTAEEQKKVKGGATRVVTPGIRTGPRD